MTALRIEFVAGRFHANPWERGMDDRDVEWPPSPWQLLRALVAGWRRAGAPQREMFLTLLDQMSEPPAFLLPRATAGNTRHYGHLGPPKNGGAENTLALDSFIALEKNRESVPSAHAIWSHVEFDREQRSVLERCCEFVTYLGRPQSRCIVSVADAVPGGEGLEGVDLSSRVMRPGPVVRRLAVEPAFRREALLAALSEGAGEMRKARRSMPIGAAWAEYRLPPNFLMVREQYDRAERTKAAFGPILLRFSLEPGTHTRKPSIKDAVVFGELLRASAIKRISEREGEPATYRLAGKSDDGSPREGHDHPYYWPFDAEGRGEIDGIDVWFPHGCTHPEYLAVTSVSELREHVVYGDKFSLTFIGPVASTIARTWRTATPIVLDRFPKVRGTNGTRRVIDAAPEQVAAMVARATGRAARVELWSPGRGIERRHGDHIRIEGFRRSRVRKDSLRLPIVAATVHFGEPVSGPIALGRLAHFGLGRLEPLPE